jgi:hypothetical protein
MKKIIFIALITTYASFAQNSKRIVEYNYGKNSVEFKDKDNNGDPLSFAHLILMLELKMK